MCRPHTLRDHFRQRRCVNRNCYNIRRRSDSWSLNDTCWYWWGKRRGKEEGKEKGKEKGKGKGKEGKERGRDFPDQCQTASYAPGWAVVSNFMGKIPGQRWRLATGLSYPISASAMTACECMRLRFSLTITRVIKRSYVCMYVCVYQFVFVEQNRTEG